MGIAPSDYENMVARLERQRGVRPTVPKDQRIDYERDLHDFIIQWCNSEWPRVKFIHARMDKASTVDVGAPDFVLFLPGARILCVECKRHLGKQSKEQLIWSAEMKMLNHEIHVVRSKEQFLSLVTEATKGNV